MAAEKYPSAVRFHLQVLKVTTFSLGARDLPKVNTSSKQKLKDFISLLQVVCGSPGPDSKACDEVSIRFDVCRRRVPNTSTLRLHNARQIPYTTGSLGRSSNRRYKAPTESDPPYRRYWEQLLLA